MLLPDVRLHNKKYSRFYSITDERKRKVLNVKKQAVFGGKMQKIQLKYKEVQFVYNLQTRLLCVLRNVEKKVAWLCLGQTSV